MSEDFRKCSKCFKEAPLGSFTKDSRYKDGYRKYCNDCKNEYARKYRRENSERINEKRRLKRVGKSTRYDNLKQKYGLTKEEYASLLSRQNFLCAICKSECKKLHVDHCHVTNRVRGLLCPQCNTGLGKLGDTSTTVYKAYLYLKEFEEGEDYGT